MGKEHIRLVSQDGSYWQALTANGRRILIGWIGKFGQRLDHRSSRFPRAEGVVLPGEES